MSFTLESATQFVRDLEDEKIAINVCDVFTDSNVLELVNQQKFDKNSASPTKIVFADLTSKLVKGRFKLPVSLKIFSNTEADRDSNIGGLFYEYRVYKLITDLIIRSGLCPNFIPYIAFGCCDDNKCYLITEKAGNGMQFNRDKIYPVKTLRDVYTMVNLREKQQILFQIVYALTIMQRFEISHNDLHDQNVFVMIMDEPVILKYIVESKVYKIQTKYVPYIYDWDLGQHSALGKNPKLTSFFRDDLNISDNYRFDKDIYTLFCYLDFQQNKVHKDSNIIQKEVPQIVPAFVRQPSIRNKEDTDRKKVSPESVEKLKNYTKPNRRVNVDDSWGGRPVDVYKLSRTEFNDIFKPVEAPQYAKDIFFYPVKYADNYIIFWNPFFCRITNTSTTFQAPEDYLKNNFRMFEVKEPFDTPFTYKLPTKEQANEMVDIFKTQNPDINKLLYDYLDDDDRDQIDAERLDIQIKNGRAIVKNSTASQLDAWAKRNENLWNSITILYCNDNQLLYLPYPLPNGLKELHCNDNQLRLIPDLPTSLVVLYCHHNRLTQLPILPNGLTTLSCGNNQLTELPRLPNSLVTLRCQYNQLTKLPRLPKGLKDLDIIGNPELERAKKAMTLKKTKLKTKVRFENESNRTSKERADTFKPN